ncbi:two-component system regulatory protein YycI [Aminipila luticellarii]|nr:two-component system regulatory protein YycI [Aminipila luticellarii]
MDWSKAKNILIVALIATNIFLLCTYLTKNNADNQVLDQDVLFAILKEKNVFVDTEIPDKYENMPAITIEYNNGRQAQIEQALKQDIYMIPANSSQELYRQTADQFLEDNQLGRDNLIFDKVLTHGKSTVVRYKNSYKKVAIGDSFVEVSFQSGKVKDVTRQCLSLTPKSKKKLKVSSPEEALLLFMSEKNSEEIIHVEKMQLVFWVNSSDFNGESLISDTAFPAWEITYNGGKTKYIDAYKA